jgi:hypothetical protein
MLVATTFTFSFPHHHVVPALLAVSRPLPWSLHDVLPVYRISRKGLCDTL